MQCIPFSKSNLCQNLALAIGLSGLSGFSLAQDSDLRMLEEVVVTAQKREEVLTDVPISVDAFNGDMLNDAGVKTVGDLPNMVPGMRMDQQGAFTQPTIRGIGSSTAGAGFTSNVATYVDGFYVPSQLGTDMQMLNLASVQVLKGPQGTLFGRNATGGAILLETKVPSFDPALELEATVAQYNEKGIKFYGSTGLTDTLAVDVAAIYSSGDGYVDNIVTGDDDSAAYDNYKVRVSALYQPTDDLSINLAYSHSDTDDPRNNMKGVYEGHTSARFVSGAIIPDDFREFASTSPVTFTSKSDGYFLTVEQAMGDLSLKSLTMYNEEESHSQIDLDSSNIKISSIEFIPKNKTFTQEFNLSGQTDKLDWVTGLFYMKYKETFDNLQATDTFPIRVYDQIGNEIKSIAAFVDGTYSLTDNLHLTMGLRWSREEADAYVNGHIVLGDMPKWNESWNSTTPRVVLRYDLNEDSMIYASYSEGFKAGQLQPAGFSTQSVDPEQVNAYEIGYKINTGGTKFEAAAFYYDYQDMQVASFIQTQALVTNAASSTIQGAEFKFTTFLTDSVTFNVGAAYTDGQYDDFPGSQPRQLDPLQANYLSILDGNAGGNQMLRTPKWTGNMALQYTTNLADGTLTLSSNVYYSSKFYFDANEQFEQDAYSTLNLRAEWRSPDEHYKVALYGTNVTDEDYITQILPGANDVQQGYSEPAVYGVSVGYTF